MVEVGQQLGNLILKVVLHLRSALALQSQRFDRSAAGCAADPKIDAPGIQRVQRAENFGDLERRVVREHDSAGADPDPLRLRADTRQQDLGRGTCQRLHRVVFRHPEARVAKPVDQLGQRDRIL
jgi:hypothetical protein